MKEFLFLFRRDYKTTEIQPTPDELKTHLEHWRVWFTELSKQGILARPPQPWDGEGKVIRRGKGAINGPFAEIKESIGGMIIINAIDYEAAEKIAQDCPIFELDGSVEIRMGL
ncbi:MAG TPA: YciI family protein [Mucilaginibacter sp.]|jgi:hypothetical protein|nr:YciI family protein [Mucilaginibacter sp.]